MRDKVKRNFVCVKIIKIKNIPKKEREATKMEVDLLKRLHHPNIVGYVDSFLSKNHESLCICMEYCDGVCLYFLTFNQNAITLRYNRAISHPKSKLQEGIYFQRAKFYTGLFNWLLVCITCIQTKSYIEI